MPQQKRWRRNHRNASSPLPWLWWFTKSSIQNQQHTTAQQKNSWTWHACCLGVAKRGCLTNFLRVIAPPFHCAFHPLIWSTEWRPGPAFFRLAFCGTSNFSRSLSKQQKPLNILHNGLSPLVASFTIMMAASQIAFVAVVALMCTSAVVDAWGTEGHGIVATIAQHRLTARTKQQVESFVGDRTFQSICMIPDSYKGYPQVCKPVSFSLFCFGCHP